MTQRSRLPAPVSPIRREAYPAAREASPKLHAYFSAKAEKLKNVGEETGSVPSADVIEAIVNAAFWASLRREEGATSRISLAFVAPEQTAHSFVFERPLPMEPAMLTRVAPAVEHAGIHLGVWRDSEQELRVWGAARGIPKLCLVVEAAAPGLIVVKNQSGGASGKFVNVAVLEGDQVKFVNRQTSGVPDYPSLLTSLLGFDSSISWVRAPSIFVQLAVGMRSHGHGGSLLVVNSGTDVWRDSIVPPIPYALSPRFSGLAQLSDAEPERRLVDGVAGLTAVDGAVVLTDRCELLGFGAKIMRRKGRPQVEQVRVMEPIEDGMAALVHPEHLGGTRHLSAAQFVHDQRDAAALVASQDGRFTIFEWSPHEEIVYAHRVETLLL
jgi:sensor domain DACNV-containing protein